MKNLLLIVLLSLGSVLPAQGTRTIHVFVALCDNVNQGIVPVPESIGNGQKPSTNLYWGAGYGVKNFFKVKSSNWKYLEKIPSENPMVLDRLLFKHATEDVYLLAEAYDGIAIRQCTIDFLKAADGTFSNTLIHKENQLEFGGKADLVTYIGHTGLMEFDLELELCTEDNGHRDAIMLSCYSRDYFQPFIKTTGIRPLVWSTHLMSPEAYTLEWALRGWVANESPAQIRERAAQAYNNYQKCGIRGARGLLVTGFRED